MTTRCRPLLAVALWLALPVPAALATAYTSTTTGNWSSAATWGGAGVPGAGDSATIATGTTVTVDVNTAVGTSPANQTTFDLTVNGPTGKLIIGTGITLTMNGNAYANAGGSGNVQNGIVWNAGASLVWPTHNVSGGYVLKCGQYNTYATSGTSSGSPAYIGTTSGSTTNACLTGASASYQSCFTAAYMTFQRLGSSSVAAMACSVAAATTNGAISASFDHCTFDTVGQLLFSFQSATATTGSLSLTNSRVTTSLKNATTAVEFFGSYGTTGTNQITGNVFGDNGDTSVGVTFSPPGNATISGNYFGALNSQTSVTTGSPDKASGTYSGNLYLASGNGLSHYQSLSNCYLVQNNDNQNGSILSNWTAYGGNRTMDTCVVECTYSQGTNSVGDMIFPLVDTTAATVSGTSSGTGGNVRLALSSATTYNAGDTVCIGDVQGTTEANGVWTVSAVDSASHLWVEIPVTYTNAWTSGGNVARANQTLAVTNTIVVPGGPARAGVKWLSLLNQSYTAPMPQVSVQHCTWATSNYGTSSENGVGVGEGVPTHASGYGWPGSITSFKSNLAWSPDATHPGYLMVRQGLGTPPPNPIQDYVAAGNADYNWGYQLATDGGTSPIYGYYRWAGFQQDGFFSSGSPDAHGCVSNATYQGNPNFVDSTRCLATYSAARLSISPSKGSWATSTSYSVGDTVSNVVSGYYGGAAVNYRCIAAHTSGSTTQPGSGASWRTDWEFDSLYRIRQGMQGNGSGSISDLVAWVRAGFMPQNASAATAAHDGTTVGAVQYQASGTPAGIGTGGAQGGVRGGIKSGGRGAWWLDRRRERRIRLNPAA